MPDNPLERSSYSEKVIRIDLGHLPAELGFIETDKLITLREELLAAFEINSPKLSYFLDAYRDAGEQLLETIESSDTEKFQRGQIGFQVAQANIFYEAGKLESYRTHLEDALTYAHNMRFDDVANQIAATLDKLTDKETETTTEPAGMNPEFAVRAAGHISLNREAKNEAIEASLRAQNDPENPLNRPPLDKEKLGQLAQAFAVLSAGTIATYEPLNITDIEYDPATKQLQAKDLSDRPLPPIPVLSSIAMQPTLEGVDREASYANVRLAFALTALALSELDEEKVELSDKAIASIQASLQKIRELTIHYPLASLSEGLRKIQIVGLLNGINQTITPDPVKTALLAGTDPLQRALDRIKS